MSAKLFLTEIIDFPWPKQRLPRAKYGTGEVSQMGHLLPVAARKSRQVITQKPPVKEQNVTAAEVPPKAAGRRLAGRGQNRPVPIAFRSHSNMAIVSR
ncbi:MAG: hypothetical protein ACI9XZ_004748 [Alphaproteobacteria bacterium]|jgi:hypothetical protein